MSLTLVTVPSPTQQYPSGLIALRAEDFVGPARGTLTTAADADSLAGTVVVETQAISLATTSVSYSTRWAAAADTLEIPWATLTALFPANTNGAYVWLSMKVTGDTATGGDAFTSTNLRWASGGLGPGLAWGNDTTLRLSGNSVWRSVWGNQYMMTNPTFFLTSDMSGTNLTSRVWGITGGTLSFSVDAVYVMPQITDMGLRVFPSDFPVFVFGGDGTMDVDFDQDPADVPFGGHNSVTFMAGNPIGGIVTLADIQTANDEPTYYDINGNGLWNGSSDPPGADPPTWLSLMCAPIYLPAQSMISDPFSNTHINTGPNLIVTTPSRFTKRLEQGNFQAAASGDGMSEDTGSMRARITASQTAPTPIQSSFWPHCTTFFGADAVLSGDTNTPDHQHPRFLELEDCVQTFSFSTDTLGVYRIMCGQTDDPGDPLPSGAETISSGAFLEFDGSGNLDLSLVSSDSTFVPTLGGSGVDARITIDGPFNVTGSFATSTVYWLKVARQRYFWKAKCWADGNTEPDWQISGFQYLVGAGPTIGLNRSWVAHPYDTNWAGDANHDVVRRNPLDSRGVPFIFVEPDFGQSAADIRFWQYDLDIDPEGATVVDMNVQEEKWDGTAVWDAVTVPYSTLPSWRMAEGSLRNRHFDMDTNGYNLRLWRDAGGSVLQHSAVPWLFERATVQGGVIPLFRPRVFSASGV